MKKTMTLALVFMASASLFSAMAGKKKETKQAVQPAATVLKTSSDSMSYAAGKTATQGLIPFIQQQYKVDTAYLESFVRGYQKAMESQQDPAFVAYMAGMQIAGMAQQRILPSVQDGLEGTKDSISAEFFNRGFIAALQKDNSVYTDSAAQKFFESRRQEVKEAVVTAYKNANVQWLADNAKKEGVVTLPSGLQYKVLVAGTGEKPKATDEAVVKYEGKLIDGTIFDSSYKRNPDTSSFRCDKVIQGWTEALQLMPVGSKWELYIPQELAYGQHQTGQIKPFSTLIFTVELISFKPSMPEVQNAPETKAPANKVVKKASPRKKK